MTSKLKISLEINLVNLQSDLTEWSIVSKFVKERHCHENIKFRN